MSVKINSKNNKIIATRGDTIIAKINIKDAEGEDYTPDPTDEIRFALKKDFNDEECLLIKPIPVETMELRIQSDDTKDLEQPGIYIYDIQITYGDGIVNTFITSTLELTPEVE